MKRAARRLVGVKIPKVLHEKLCAVAERETEGNLSMILRRALEEYAARNGNGERVPAPSPASAD
jgi:hypothetical protein